MKAKKQVGRVNASLDVNLARAIKKLALELEVEVDDLLDTIVGKAIGALIFSKHK